MDVTSEARHRMKEQSRHRVYDGNKTDKEGTKLKPSTLDPTDTNVYSSAVRPAMPVVFILSSLF